MTLLKDLEIRDEVVEWMNDCTMGLGEYRISSCSEGWDYRTSSVHTLPSNFIVLSATCNIAIVRQWSADGP